MLSNFFVKGSTSLFSLYLSFKQLTIPVGLLVDIKLTQDSIPISSQKSTSTFPSRDIGRGVFPINVSPLNPKKLVALNIKKPRYRQIQKISGRYNQKNKAFLKKIVSNSHTPIQDYNAAEYYTDQEKKDALNESCAIVRSFVTSH